MPEPALLEELVNDIRHDLTSGAAEIALRAITIFQTMLSETETLGPAAIKERLSVTAKALIAAQPAMAPLFHLGNSVLMAVSTCSTSQQIRERCHTALADFEKQLCQSAQSIADLVYDLVPAGDLVLAYSFSSTVVSSLLNCRSKGKFFRAVCTEARPMMEGRKLSTVLADGGLEVIHTFDCAIGLVLPNCRAAFMGCDCVGRPGIVNKVGSWLLAVSCRELGIPLYALAGTEKFVTDEQLFTFEDHERPGEEVWEDPPKGVRVLNRQFELINHSMLAGLVTERGILREDDIEQYVSKVAVHEALR